MLQPAPGAAAVDPATVAAERFRLLTASTDALLQAAAERPVVLVLEDLHWADAESLELLRRVATEAGTAPLLVLGTLRDALPDEVAPAIADVRRGRATAALPLGPLSRVDVVDYLRTVDAATAADRAPEVHRRTGGLPLLLAAAASGVDGAAEGDLELVVAGLLGRLAPDERRVVELLALLGAPAADAAAGRGVRDGHRPRWRPGSGPGGGPACSAGPPTTGSRSRTRCCRTAYAARCRRTRRPAGHRRAAEVLAGRLAGRPGAGRRGRRALAAGRRRPRRRAVGGPLRRAGGRARRPRSLALDDAVRHLRDAADVAPPRRRGRRGDRPGCWSGSPPPSSWPAGWPTAWPGARPPAGLAAAAGRPDLVAAAALVIRGVTSPNVAAGGGAAVPVRAGRRPAGRHPGPAARPAGHDDGGLRPAGGGRRPGGRGAPGGGGRRRPGGPCWTPRGRGR